MEYILYKKNIPILKYEETNGYIEVKQVYNKEHLPVHLYINGKASDSNLYALNEKLEEFLDNRLIPSTRKNFSETLNELEIKSNLELAKKSWFLSLSDQYWVCPIEQKDKLFWEDINFFKNDYDSAIGLRLVRGSKSLNKNTSSYSPDNTTNGELPKRWVKIDGINYLEKAGSGTEQQEPLNEVLASEICRRLGIPFVPYQLKIEDEKYYSLCPDMVDEDSELVSMDAVYQDLHLIDNTFYDFNQLLFRCQSLGIPDAENTLLKIILVDFIIANVDRHAYNISFIRNSNNLQWKALAPVYDSGKSMFLNLLDFEMKMKPSSQIESKPFYPNQAEQIKNLPMHKISTQINLSNLADLDKWYSDFLQPLKRLSKEKKQALVEKLRERIEEAKKYLSPQAQLQKSSQKTDSINLIFSILKADPTATKEEVAAATGLSRATVTRSYQKLAELGKIKRIGSNKTGHWKITE